MPRTLFAVVILKKQVAANDVSFWLIRQDESKKVRDWPVYTDLAKIPKPKGEYRQSEHKVVTDSYNAVITFAISKNLDEAPYPIVIDMKVWNSN